MAGRNLDQAEGAIFHSDCGSNYTWAGFAAVLGRLAIRHSVGGIRTCCYNALAESWNATSKVERVIHTVHPTGKKAMDDIARYIELRYSLTRLNSALSYRTPLEIHNEYLNRQRAA